MKASKKLFGPFWPYGGPKKGQKRTFAKKETAVVSGFFHVFAFFAKTAWCIRKKRVFREKRWKRPKTAKNSQNGQNPENLVEKKAWKPSDAPLFTYPQRNSPKPTPKPLNRSSNHQSHFYKIRLAIPSKGKGKSGGARVITYVKVTINSVYLVSIYDKSEDDAITDKELAAIFKSMSWM